MNESVDWLRNTDPGRLDRVDDVTAVSVMKLEGISYEGLTVFPDDNKRKALQDALTLICNNDPKIDDAPADDAVLALSKITG